MMYRTTVDNPPKYCSWCGKELIREEKSFAQGYDSFTGEERPSRSWSALKCPDGHDSWHLSPEYRVWYRV